MLLKLVFYKISFFYVLYCKIHEPAGIRVENLNEEVGKVERIIITFSIVI